MPPGRCIRSSDTLCYKWDADFLEKGLKDLSSNHQLQIVTKLSVFCCHLGNTKKELSDLPERFRLFTNYFGPVLRSYFQEYKFVA